ncbi:30S ribosomal protein S6 [Trichloromonas sp.]|uniref:30S ribosomal protein S6 n=1 Tax=Trichloromonas sp. TaxID=3069249 RepID=UPI002A4BA647|nr:30S ribosomal protein S6 [Trichloromonas sp.]
MRTYETIYIVHPELVGDGYQAIVEKFKGILGDLKANILKVDEWGTRKLAYPVKKQQRGTYVLMAYEAAADAIAELERRMRIDENVIKFQTVLLENGYQESASEAGVVESSEEESEEETEENE